MAPGLMNPFIKFPSGVDVVGGWVELDRTTLGSAGDTITVSSLADKRYYMVLGHNLPSGNFRTTYRINNDSGSVYALRKSEDGLSENVTVSQIQIKVGNQDAAFDYFDVSYFANLSANEKLMINHNMRNGGTGASNSPNRVEAYAKWDNTSSVLNRIDAVNDQGGDYATGSEVVVLGWDPSDTHTTNFWEELASVNASGSSTNLSSGTITAKKYLWIQCYLKNTTSHTSDMTFNNDTTTYAYRVSDNGATDSLSTSQNDIELFSATTTPVFVNMFIVNVSANEKLVIGHTVNQSTAGVGNVSNRRQFVGKWDNTASQITEIDIDSSSGNWDSASIINVWGSN